MQCLTKLWCLQQADFMNTRTKNRSKNRKTMALCFTRTIMIRHWVVNWRANRLKDVLTRDRTVHYFFFREWNAYGLMNMKKGTRFPSTVLNWVQKLHALIVMVNSGGPVLPYRKWQVRHWTKRVWVLRRLGSLSGFTYQPICQLFLLFGSLKFTDC